MTARVRCSLSRALLLVGLGASRGAAQPVAPPAPTIPDGHPVHDDLWVPPSQPFLTVRQAGEHLLAEISQRSLGLDFSVLAATAERLSGGSLSKDVSARGENGPFRWGRSGDSLVLLEYHYQQMHYVRRGAYPVLQITPDSAFVIDAGALFGLVAGGATFVDHVPDTKTAARSHAWPVTFQQVTTTLDDFTTIGLAYQRTSEGTQTHQVGGRWHVQQLRLPDPMMRPRRWDARLSYWDATLVGDSSRTATPLLRWRLEKKDPTAAISDVVRPILYRIDSTVPHRWIPWVRRAIEAWNPVFEAIGFRHALVVQAGGAPAPPVAGAEPRECRVSWAPGYQVGAQTSPDVQDRRSGEILHCWIQLNNGTIGLAQRYAFLYLGGLDPHMHYPYPDSVSGRLLQALTTHEVGHSLGFSDQARAGAAYLSDSLRSAAFVRRMGHVSSIMSYSFYNAVAQPEDHLPPDALLQTRPGPYDIWALGWGYRPIPEATSTAEEGPILERWRAAQDTAPYLHVANAGFDDIDPGNRLNALGRDAMSSADAVIRNLARTVPTIDAQRDTGITEAPSLAENLRTDALALWWSALYSPLIVIGGGIPQDPYAQLPEKTRIVPIDSAQQVHALHAVLAHLFYGQDPLVQAVFRRPLTDTTLLLFEVAPAGWTVGQWRDMQRSLMSTLANRAARVAAQTSTTHVLPVYCGALAALDHALETAGAQATQPADRLYVEQLRRQFHPLFDKGACCAPPPSKG